MLILVGSRALKLQAPSLLLRNPKDFDFMGSKDEIEGWMKDNEALIEPTKIHQEDGGKKVIYRGKGGICEFEVLDSSPSGRLFADLVGKDANSRETKRFGLVPSVDLLFTLKASHRFLKNSPHFWKNLQDYHSMRLAGATIHPEFKPFLSLREEETYLYLHPRLNQTKKQFFSDDQIDYRYDHDSIHLAIALGDRPAYSYYLKDGEEVQTDRKKFFEVEESIRINGVIEEACVLAIERSLVPHPGALSPQQAWRLAFSKVCTSITSGYFREWAYENALKILPRYPEDYWDRFQSAVEQGRVKDFR